MPKGGQGWYRYIVADIINLASNIDRCSKKTFNRKIKIIPLLSFFFLQIDEHQVEKKKQEKQIDQLI